MRKIKQFFAQRMGSHRYDRGVIVGFWPVEVREYACINCNKTKLGTRYAAPASAIEHLAHKDYR